MKRIKLGKSIVSAMIAGLMLVGTVSEGKSRGSTRSSTTRSSTTRSGGGFGYKKPTTVYKKPTTYTTPTKSKVTTTTTKPAIKSGGGFGASKVNTNSTQYKKVNSKISKNFGNSTKKYKNKASVKADLGAKMATKKYTYKDNASAMSNRPNYIPSTHGGYNTSYHNGRYGYYDGSGMFMAYLAADMIVTDMQMRAYAPNAMYYNQQPVYQQQVQPQVVYTHRSPFITTFVLACFIIVILGVVLHD